jgi:phosphate/sulfate permease
VEPDHLYLTIPSSSSHALIGGVIGATLVASGSGAIDLHKLVQAVIVPALLSPFICGAVALLGTFAAYRLIRMLRAGEPEKGYRLGQIGRRRGSRRAAPWRSRWGPRWARGWASGSRAMGVGPVRLLIVFVLDRSDFDDDLISFANGAERQRGVAARGGRLEDLVASLAEEFRRPGVVWRRRRPTAPRRTPQHDRKGRLMCRWLAYSGSPLLLKDALYGDPTRWSARACTRGWGLRDDPPAAVEGAIGFVEEIAGRHDVPHPFQGTIATA